MRIPTATEPPIWPESKPTIAIAHDYFTQRGGAERVAATLVEQLDPETLITAVYNASQTFDIGPKVDIEVSFLQRFRIVRHDARRAFPLIPIAWRLFSPVRTDVLLCSSSGWAHALRAATGCTKVVYCHNPARWLYQTADYFKDQNKALACVMRAVFPLLRRWDRRAARSADLYIANSRSVAKRIKQVYGLDAVVIPPPVSINVVGPVEPIDVANKAFYLAVGRQRGYKNIDILVEAFRGMPDRQLIIVGDAGANPPHNVTAIADVSEAMMRWLYRNATALVSVAFEDFGLTPLEANLFGTPALLLRAGGFLDSLVEGVNGYFIDYPTSAAVQKAVASFPFDWDSSKIVAHAQQYTTSSFVHKLLTAIGEVRPG